MISHTESLFLVQLTISIAFTTIIIIHVNQAG